MLTRKCRECGKEFPLIRRDKRFCCEKCRNKHWVKDHPRSAANTNKDE